MPMIDISIALTSLMLADVFMVIRRTETVDQYGESTITAQTFFPVYGTVQAASPNDLKRLPDEQHQGKNLSIVTKFPLQGVAPGMQPDIIQWPMNNAGANADNFVVAYLDDYSQYAQGFVQAIARSIDMVDFTPTPN